MSLSKVSILVLALAGASALAAVVFGPPGLGLPAGEPSVREVSPAAAASLGRKIEAIRAASQDSSRPAAAAQTLSASDVELESFVLYSMKEEIPARLDSIDVGIRPGVVSAAVQLTFDSARSSGNPVVDMLIGGTHALFVEGALEGRLGRGRFRLEQVRVDGIPVPLFVVEALVDRFVKPRYPQVDLAEPFDMPWGIEEIVLSPDTATFTY
jgi:hypothetical protein